MGPEWHVLTEEECHLHKSSVCCMTAVLLGGGQEPPIQPEMLVEKAQPRPGAAAGTAEGRAGQLDHFHHPQALDLFLLSSALHGVLPLGDCLSLYV